MTTKEVEHMEQPVDKGLADLVAEVARRQAEIEATMEHMRAVCGKATAHKGMLTVTVGSQGEVTEVKFDNRDYKRMEPKELGRIVLDAIREARSEQQLQLKEILGPLCPPGISFDDVMSGTFDLAG